MFAPGDVILVDFPGVQGVKPRPTIVVSTDTYMRVRPDVTFAIVTSHLAAAKTTTDYVLEDWQSAGLHVPSAYRSFFATLSPASVHYLIGHLSDRDWQEVQARLRLAIAVS